MTLLHKCPDMHYVEHKLVKNMLPSHHVKHDDGTKARPKCRRAEKQAVSRHPVWLDMSFIKASVVGGVCRIKPLFQ
jgi:hypothetical protein